MVCGHLALSEVRGSPIHAALLQIRITKLDVFRCAYLPATSGIGNGAAARRRHYLAYSLRMGSGSCRRRLGLQQSRDGDSRERTQELRDDESGNVTWRDTGKGVRQ